MFTGLIESICTVSSAVRQGGGLRVIMPLSQDAKYGESIAVNGVCLTIAEVKGNSAQFEVSGETLSRTTLGGLKAGAQVNIERALQANGRFGGHFVQGHIDAVGKVRKIEKKGDFWQFVFEAPKDIWEFLIPKGSIAIDGVSLTITDVEKGSFGTAIIPTTFENTIFKNYKVGDSVNIETDMICRIVKKQIENISASAKAMADKLPDKSNLTIEKLKDLGF